VEKPPFCRSCVPWVLPSVFHIYVNVYPSEFPAKKNIINNDKHIISKNETNLGTFSRGKNCNIVCGISFLTLWILQCNWVMNEDQWRHNEETLGCSCKDQLVHHYCW
jgi:hypothetical protein